MKKLLILAAMAAALTAGSMTVSAAPVRNGPGFCRAAFAACQTVAEDALVCANRCGRIQNGGSAECPNDGVPALDGTGYRGGRNNADGSTENAECPNDLCPNDGVPARDGTGYRGGRNGADGSAENIECPNDLCPNDGVPARDGTRYRGGRNGANGSSGNAACPNGGLPARDGTGYRGGRNR